MNERSVWAHDPHERAYRVLFAPKSLEILRRLGVTMRDGQPSDAISERHWQNCLACHNPTGAGAQPSQFVSHEGVGCEACHGPGEQWIRAHWRDAKGFRSQGPDTLRELGFRDTKDLFVRAAMCAECHVGQPGGDVDHELIAAGHPMLAFELSSHTRVMPAHWDEECQQQRLEGDQQLRGWLVGQLATAKAALEQLSRRAKGPQAWPEFSEQECFTCHHRLDVAGRWRADQGLTRGDTGRIVAPWRKWNLGLAELVLPEIQQSEAAASIRSLQTAMQSDLVPDRRAVREQVAAAIAGLDAAINSLNAGGSWPANVDLPRLHRRVVETAVAGPDGQHTVQSWERAAQLYFAVAANVTDRANPPDNLVTLRRLLSEDESAAMSSPASFNGALNVPPEQSRREEIRRLLEAVIREP